MYYDRYIIDSNSLLKTVAKSNERFVRGARISNLGINIILHAPYRGRLQIRNVNLGTRDASDLIPHMGG